MSEPFFKAEDFVLIKENPQPTQLSRTFTDIANAKLDSLGPDPIATHYHNLLLERDTELEKLRAQLEVVAVQRGTRGYPKVSEWVGMCQRIDEIGKGKA